MNTSADDLELVRRIFRAASLGWNAAARRAAKREAFHRMGKVLAAAARERGIIATADDDGYVFRRLARHERCRAYTCMICLEEVGVVCIASPRAPASGVGRASVLPLAFDGGLAAWVGLGKARRSGVEVAAEAIVAALSRSR